MLEDNLRRALAVADGQFSFLWDRPTTVVLMSLVVIAILIPMTRALWPKSSR